MAVSDISQDAVNQRRLRADSVSGMLLIVVLMGMMSGVLMGLCISALINAGDKYNEMRAAYENSSTWHSMVSAKLPERCGIDTSELPTLEEPDE